MENGKLMHKKQDTLLRVEGETTLLPFLMEKMGGEITAGNKDGGLAVTLRLRLL